MSRYDNSMDTPWFDQGDTGFVGYNEKMARYNLPPGIVSKSINKRFTDNIARRRHPITMIPGNSHWVDTLSNQFIASFVYTNPNKDERLMLAQIGRGEASVNIFAYNVATDNFLPIALPGITTLSTTNTVWFAQSFQYLIMLIGGTPPLFKTYTASGGREYITNGMYWDGTETGTPAFQWFPEPDDAGGGGPYVLQIVPPAEWATPVSNRIAYFGVTEPAGSNPIFSNNGSAELDHLFFSDIEKPFQCDPILSDFRINTGEGDQIVAMIPYAYDSLVIFMHKSIHMISNFSALNPTTGLADFSQTVQEVITSYQGSGSILGVMQVGQQVYYWVEKLGLFRLMETLEKRLMAHPLPASDDIQPVIDRINWAAQDKIVSNYQDNYLFFAVPLDSSTVANAILVYNTTSQNPNGTIGNWESVDEFAMSGFSIDNILAVHYGDVRRLVGIMNGPPQAYVFLLYDETASQDQIKFSPAQYTNIFEQIDTRGYGLNGNSGPGGQHRFLRGTTLMASNSANISVTALNETLTESIPIRTNVPYTERFKIGLNDRTMSLRITNTSGECDIISTSVEGIEIKRGLRKTVSP